MEKYSANIFCPSAISTIISTIIGTLLVLVVIMLLEDVIPQHQIQPYHNHQLIQQQQQQQHQHQIQQTIIRSLHGDFNLINNNNIYNSIFNNQNTNNYDYYDDSE